MSTLRSKFIQFVLTAVLLAGIALAGHTPAASQGIYNEAPMLAELVKAGKLPPVDERVPANPVLIKPVEEVGQYGGTWRMAKVKTDMGIIWRTMMYEGLVRWNPQWTAVIPNLAQTVESSPDATTYTFKLRKGVRWSDGAPFTADDILFWYNDVFLNPELSPSHRTFLDVQRGKFSVEKSDDYTVNFKFDEPNGLFLQLLAQTESTIITSYPKHFLQKYHASYNPTIGELVKQEGMTDWIALFNKYRGGALANVRPGTPVLFAWMFEEGTTISAIPGEVFYAVRNPYYWKIDTDFNQLPYIDRLSFTVVADPVEASNHAVEGKVDYQNRNMLPNIIRAKENQARGNYDILQLVEANANGFAIYFNQTVDDPTKREIFQNRDFRIGLSHGLNRPALIEILGGNLEMAQASPLSATPFYDEEFTKQYLAYDVKLANEYLDKAGYKRDVDGKRLGPDGKPIRFSIVLPDLLNYHKNEKVHQQLIGDWGALGIGVEVRVTARADSDKMLSPTSETFNQYDVFIWGADGGYDVVLNPLAYLPVEVGRNIFAPRWTLWGISPTDAKATVPPDYIQKQLALYKQVTAASDVDQQTALMKEILSISKAQFYVLGVFRTPTLYAIKQKNFYNVPSVMISAAIYPNPAPTNPCQYFIK